MRINVYHHEMPFACERIELVEKKAEGFIYYGIRIYTAEPLMDVGNDDDSSAITFWYPTVGKERLPDVRLMAMMLNKMSDVNYALATKLDQK